MHRLTLPALLGLILTLATSVPASAAYGTLKYGSDPNIISFILLYNRAGDALQQQGKPILAQRAHDIAASLGEVILPVDLNGDGVIDEHKATLSADGPMPQGTGTVNVVIVPADLDGDRLPEWYGVLTDAQAKEMSHSVPMESISLNFTRARQLLTDMQSAGVNPKTCGLVGTANDRINSFFDIFTEISHE